MLPHALVGVMAQNTPYDRKASHVWSTGNQKIKESSMMEKQTAGRKRAWKLCSEIRRAQRDVLFGEVWSRRQGFPPGTGASSRYGADGKGIWIVAAIPHPKTRKTTGVTARGDGGNTSPPTPPFTRAGPNAGRPSAWRRKFMRLRNEIRG
jgi:hypothetical protein